VNFLWYDYETYGVNTKCDRIAQFGSIRTDEELNPIGDEYSIFSEIADDYLPDPEACLVHGLTPNNLSGHQLKEGDFANKISEILCKPGTCAVGFNNNIFDDEFTRFLFYRNLIDPYAWHWQNGNSRWDILNLARTISALRPTAINIKTTEKGYSFKLQDLADSNNVAAKNAHDALSDAKTTLGLAHVFKKQAEDIFDASFRLREKTAVTEFIKTQRLKPIIYTSRYIPSSFKSTSIVVPICRHPSYRDHYVAVDLRHDISRLFNSSTEELKSLLFSKNIESIYPQSKPRFHIIKFNRCPSVYNINLATEASIKEMGFDRFTIDSNVDEIKNRENVLINKINGIFFGTPTQKNDYDPEKQLYDNFLDDDDRSKCDYFLSKLRLGIVLPTNTFNDRRLQELAWRYLHRNYPDKRSSPESEERWNEFVANRLTSKRGEEGLSYLEENKAKIIHLQQVTSNLRDNKVLSDLLNRLESLQSKYIQSE